MSELRSIETAPKDGSEILAFGGRRYDIVAWHTGHHSGFWTARSYLNFEPTHWMPLPEPPEQSHEPTD